MKILINGSSVSANDGSWPFVLRDQLDCDIVNLSLAGAGNNYIAESTIEELSRRSYDLVLIMWSDFIRTDIKVSHISPTFSDVYYTSLNQVNNTTAKKTVVEKARIQKDWVFSLAQLGDDNPIDSVKALYDGYYKSVLNDHLMANSIIKMISLQGVLKTLNCPYLFLSYTPTVGHQRFSHLYNMLDPNNIYNGECLYSIATKNGWWDHEDRHPTAPASKVYADSLITRIEQITGHLPRRI